MEEDDDWKELYVPGMEVHDKSKEITWPEGKVVPDSPVADQWQKLVDKRRKSKILVGRVVTSMIATIAAFGAGATLGVAFAVGGIGLVGLVGFGFVVIVALLVVLSIVWLTDD